MNEREEFIDSLKKITGYQEMHDFIIEEFSTGEVITELYAFTRFRQKYPSSKVLNNWSGHLLFETVITSLAQEGRVHLLANGTGGEYMVNPPKDTEISQEKMLDDKNK